MGTALILLVTAFVCLTAVALKMDTKKLKQHLHKGVTRMNPLDRGSQPPHPEDEAEEE